MAVIPELSPIGFWKIICLDRASGRIPQLPLAHPSPSGLRRPPQDPVVVMLWDQDVSAAKLQAASSAERRRFIRATTVLKARLVTPAGTVEATVLDASLNGVKLWAGADVPIGTTVTLLLAGAGHFGGGGAWRREIGVVKGKSV